MEPIYLLWYFQVKCFTMVHGWIYRNTAISLTVVHFTVDEFYSWLWLTLQCRVCKLQQDSDFQPLTQILTTQDTMDCSGRYLLLSFFLSSSIVNKGNHFASLSASSVSKMDISRCNVCCVRPAGTARSFCMFFGTTSFNVLSRVSELFGSATAQVFHRSTFASSQWLSAIKRSQEIIIVRVLIYYFFSFWYQQICQQ